MSVSTLQRCRSPSNALSTRKNKRAPSSPRVAPRDLHYGEHYEEALTILGVDHEQSATGAALHESVQGHVTCRP